MTDLCSLKRKLTEIDSQLARHRGPVSPQQRELLRLRRECLLRMKDAERSLWGDRLISQG